MDRVSIIGLIGLIPSTLAPYLDMLGIVGQSIAAAGGVILVILSVYLKLLQIKQKKKELEES